MKGKPREVKAKSDEYRVRESEKTNQRNWF